MNFVRSLFFVLPLVLFISVQCKKMCILNDYECMTKEGQKLYKSIPVKDIDPLRIDELTGSTGNFKYRLLNLTLTGFSNCDVTFMTANKVESKFEHHLTCPKLIIKYMYEVNGKLNNIEMYGKQSTGQITATNYVIIIYGEYEITISETDGTPHFYDKSFYIDTHPGHLKFESGKLLTTEGVDLGPHMSELVNKNWRVYERHVRDPIITKFIEQLIARFNKQLGTVKLSETFTDDS